MDVAISPADLFTPESWQSFVSWFWSKVDDSAGPEGCWPWTGHRRPDGYGIVQRIMGLRAHRVALMLASGPIPQGLEALHSATTRPAVIRGTFERERAARIWPTLSDGDVTEGRVAVPVAGEGHEGSGTRDSSSARWNLV